MKKELTEEQITLCNKYKFDMFQTRHIINRFTKYNLTYEQVSLYANPEFSHLKMKEAIKIIQYINLNKNIKIEQYINSKLSYSQMREIRHELYNI